MKDEDVLYFAEKAEEVWKIRWTWLWYEFK